MFKMTLKPQSKLTTKNNKLASTCLAKHKGQVVTLSLYQQASITIAQVTRGRTQINGRK